MFVESWSPTQVIMQHELEQSRGAKTVQEHHHPPLPNVFTVDLIWHTSELKGVVACYSKYITTA